MRHRTAILVAMTLPAFSAIPSCTRSRQSANGSDKPPIQQLLVVLAHYEPGVVSFPDLTGSYPARSDPHVAVQVSCKEAEAIMAAVDKRQAMARQDYPPPGRPSPGWRSELYVTRGDGTKVQGYWHFGRETDINLPGDKRDVFQAMRETTAGRAREQVDSYFAAVARRADVVARAVEAGSAPKVEFKVQTHWATGRIVLNIIGKDAGLVVGWTLPAEITKPFRESVIPGEAGPSILLFHGRNYPPRYPVRTGSVRPPREYETALGGQLICVPKSRRKDEPPRNPSISLRNLRFPTCRIESIGPIEVQLDVPAMP